MQPLLVGKLQLLSGILMIMILVVYALIIKQTILARGYSDDEQLLQEVSTIMRLPDDEEAIIATVFNVEELVDQSFYRYAKSGDKTIIYVGAKKAILYRPSERKIIEVGEVKNTND